MGGISYTISTREGLGGDDIQARLVTIRLGAENIAIPIPVVGEWHIFAPFLERLCAVGGEWECFGGRLAPLEQTHTPSNAGRFSSG